MMLVPRLLIYLLAFVVIEEGRQRPPCHFSLPDHPSDEDLAPTYLCIFSLCGMDAAPFLCKKANCMPGGTLLSGPDRSSK